MEFLVVFGVFAAVAVVGIAALVHAIRRRSLMGLAVAALCTATVWSFGRLVYLTLFAEQAVDGPPITTNDIVMPGVLLLATIVVLWLWAYSADPKATSKATWTGVAAINAAAIASKAAKHRRRKQAEAVVDEMERRQR